jgi:hypothetical protein
VEDKEGGESRVELKREKWRMVKSERRLNSLPHTLAFCKNILLLVLVAVVLKL